MKTILVLIVLATIAPLHGQAQAPAPASPAEHPHSKPPLPSTISHGETIALKDYLVAGKTTIFDFYSDYCRPCRKLGMFLEKLHKKRDDCAVVKIDINRPDVHGIDWNSPVAMEFSLSSVPTLEVYNSDGTLRAQGDAAQALVVGWINALNK